MFFVDILLIYLRDYYHLVIMVLNMKNTKRRIRLLVKFLKHSVLAFFTLASVGITYTLAKAVGENYVVDKMIEDFIARADPVPEESHESASYMWNYYPIERIYDYEINDVRDVFYDDDKLVLGQFGDILATRQSPFRDIPLIHQFISYYFGGHAAFRDDEDGLYETTGLNVDWDTFIGAIRSHGYNSGLPNVSVQHINVNYWLNIGSGSRYAPFYRTEMMSLRLKDIKTEEIQLAQDYLDYQVGNKSLYNFLFWLYMGEKHYCTDLISRAYQSVFVEEADQRQYSRTLNDDGFITSTNDLILANRTFFTSFIKVDTTGKNVNVYYLADL